MYCFVPAATAGLAQHTFIGVEAAVGAEAPVVNPAAVVLIAVNSRESSSFGRDRGGPRLRGTLSRAARTCE